MAYMTQCFADVGITVECSFYADSGLLSQGTFDILYQGANHWLDGGCNSLYASNSNPYLGTELRDEYFNDLAVKYFTVGSAAERAEISKQLQALDYQYRQYIAIYQLQTVQMYNAAHVEFPSDIFELSNCTNYRWNEWKLIG